MKDAASIIVLLLVILASFYLGRCSASIEGGRIEIKRDTTIIEKPSEPIVVEKIKSKIKYLRDTIIQTKPFVATIDTIVKRDTIYAKYNFPENQFDLLIRKKPDSVVYHTIYLTKETKREWYETPAYFVGGTIIGYIFGVVSK